jgi:hypothetical protein
MDSLLTRGRILWKRLRAVRVDRFSDDEVGLATLAGALGLPPGTWRNYERGVAMPAEVLLGLHRAEAGESPLASDGQASDEFQEWTSRAGARRSAASPRSTEVEPPGARSYPSSSWRESGGPPDPTDARNLHNSKNQATARENRRIIGTSTRSIGSGIG